MNKQTVAVIGSGMIGISLAALFTGNGYRTFLLIRNPDRNESYRKKYDDIFAQLIAHNQLTAEEASICLSYLTLVNDYRELGCADFVFECVSEDVAAKHEVLRLVEVHCPDVRVIASTTSALSADDIAEGLLDKQSRFVVAHPFNPPHLVPCVEVVASLHTSEDTLSAVVRLLEGVGRVVSVLKRNVPGFVGNRLQYALLREAMYLVESGVATPAEIDSILKNSLMPRYTAIGLFEHQDNAGLDLIASIANYLFPVLCNDRKSPDWLNQKVAAGKLGVKAGEGIFAWSPERVEDLNERILAPFQIRWNLPERPLSV